MSKTIKTILIYAVIIIAILAVASKVYDYFVLTPAIEKKSVELARDLAEASEANKKLQAQLKTSQLVLDLGEKTRASMTEEREDLRETIELKNREIKSIQGDRHAVEIALEEELAKVPIRTDNELEISIEDVLASLNPDKPAPFFIGMTTERDTAVMINDAGLEALFSRTLIKNSNDEIALLVGKIDGLDRVIDTHLKDKESYIQDSLTQKKNLESAMEAVAAEKVARVTSEELNSLLKKKISFNFFKPGLTFNIVSVSAYDPITQRPAVGFLTVGIGWKF